MLNLEKSKYGFSNTTGCLTLGIIRRYSLIILRSKGKYPAVFGSWSKSEKEELLLFQKNTPVKLGTREGKIYWLFDEHVYWTTEELLVDDVKALLLDIERKKKRKIERAKSLMDIELSTNVTRKTIPDDVKTFVWQRDKGKCVNCGNNQNLEFDHIIPISMGGSNTARNIQLLCEKCNREKGGDLV